MSDLKEAIVVENVYLYHISIPFKHFSDFANDYGETFATRNPQTGGTEIKIIDSYTSICPGYFSIKLYISSLQKEKLDLFLDDFFNNRNIPRKY
jgi:hypothetical protein